MPRPLRSTVDPVHPLASGFRAARVNGKAANITRKDFLRLGEAQQVRNPGAIIDEVLAAVSNWDHHAAANGITPAIAASASAQQRPGL